MLNLCYPLTFTRQINRHQISMNGSCFFRLWNYYCWSYHCLQEEDAFDWICRLEDPNTTTTRSDENTRKLPAVPRTKPNITCGILPLTQQLPGIGNFCFASRIYLLMSICLVPVPPPMPRTVQHPVYLTMAPEHVHRQL